MSSLKESHFSGCSLTKSNGGMEDLTTPTIESLRARLLSERAISKASRQKADELAKRVAELEEQLNLVSLQRKKAEKATADVLAILESNGISDASEAFDSSSDQETIVSDSKATNDAVKRNETSSNFEVRISGTEANSSSEIDSSASTGRSLSWKSSKDNLHSLERKKYTETVRRRCSTFALNGSLPKRVGKSCRRIRRRETRPMGDDLPNHSSIHDFQGDTADTCSEHSANCADIKHPANNGVNELPEAPDSGLSGNRVADAYFSSRNRQDDDGIRALQHQAQTMNQYEAEDRAQRGWEEKVRENSNCVQDLSDPGNRSDITEERDEVKASGQSSPAGMIRNLLRETKLDVVKTSFTEEMERKGSYDMLVPSHFENGYVRDEKASSVVTRGSPASQFAFPASQGTYGHVFSGNMEKMPSQSSHAQWGWNPSMNVHFPNPNNKESLGSRKELALVPEKSSSKLESVLKALQQARLSLNQKLHGMPLLEVGSSSKAIEKSVPGSRTGDGMEIPVGCPGIFRLPTDYQFEATSKANYLGSNSALSSANCYPEYYSPYMEPRSSAFLGDQFSTRSSTPYTEIRSGVHRSIPPFTQGASELHTSAMPFTHIQPGIPASKPLFEPASDAGLSSSGRSTYLDPRMNAGPIPASRPLFESASDAGLSSSGRSTYLDPRMNDAALSSSGRYAYLDPRMNAGPIPALDTGLSSSGRSSYLDPPINAGLIPAWDAGLSSSGRFTYMEPQMNAGLILPREYTYPSYPFYQEMTPQLPANERLPRNVPSMEFQMPSARFSFHDDHIRPNMYK